MPGSGTAYAMCGVPVRAAACVDALTPRPTLATFGVVVPRAHVKRLVLNRCGRAECPKCYPAWAARQAERAAERLTAVEALHEDAGQRVGPVRHLVLSPSPEHARDVLARHGLADGLSRLRTEALRIGKEHGLTGGLVVTHAWRTRAHGRGRYRRGENYLSPHFHVLGFGRLTDYTTFHAETGWIYKNKGVRESVQGTIAYLLDHAAIVTRVRETGLAREHVVRWFGVAAYNKVVRRTEARVVEALRCECGKECQEFDVRADGEADWSIARGPFHVKRRRRTYRLANDPGGAPRGVSQARFSSTRTSA